MIFLQEKRKLSCRLLLLCKVWCPGLLAEAPSFRGCGIGRRSGKKLKIRKAAYMFEFVAMRAHCFRFSFFSSSDLCDPDSNLYSLDGEVGFHLICGQFCFTF
jgi:hypothetical protein